MALNNFKPANGGQNGQGGANGANPPGVPPMSAGPYPWSGDDDIDPTELMINYNERHKNDQPILFRDAVIQQTESCLIGKFKPNALLTGPAGVGKTKIAEDLARRIATQDPSIPDQLLGHTVWELPLSNIVSGSSLVGDLERKAKAVLRFAQDPANKVILFIDEIHMLVGESQTYEKIAQIMKPALARGDIKVIGATTVQEAQNLMDDPAFNRRFTRIIVDELSQDQTKQILRQMQVMMFTHYKNKIAINNTVIDEIVMVADEYKTIGSHRPDNAITLLDRSMADAYIQRKVLEEKAKADPALQQALAAMPITVLSKSQMKETAMKLMTGNNEKMATDMDSLRNSLSRIKGQDSVLDYLLDTIERNNLGLSMGGDNRPLTFLFAGNSGVGKSEIAKIIAMEMTGVKPIILNMTEYHSPASINRIIGAPAGYVGSDSKSELPFDILDSNPYQVILLDEFEKSDRSVQRLFMSAFDEGYIKTARGKVVDFSKSIIIATTNAGHDGKSSTMGFTSSENDGASVYDLSKFFDVALLNRFTKVLDFNPILERQFREIVVDTYHRYVDRVKAAHSSYNFLPDDLDDATADLLTKKGYVREFGARPIRDLVKRHVEDVILAFKRGVPVGTALTVPMSASPLDDGDGNDAPWPGAGTDGDAPVPPVTGPAQGQAADIAGTPVTDGTEPAPPGPSDGQGTAPPAGGNPAVDAEDDDHVVYYHVAHDPMDLEGPIRFVTTCTKAFWDANGYLDDGGGDGYQAMHDAMCASGAPELTESVFELADEADLPRVIASMAAKGFAMVKDPGFTVFMDRQSNGN